MDHVTRKIIKDIKRVLETPYEEAKKIELEAKKKAKLLKPKNLKVKPNRGISQTFSFSFFFSDLYFIFKRST